MDPTQKAEILEKAKDWMRNSLIASHRKNTLKLEKIEEFTINPLLLPYLAFYLEGNMDFKTLAKALVYPRVLGTSINTSFGTLMQKFLSGVLGGFGSTTTGIDIEFIDKVDGRKKYAQVKAGPNAINRDDVTTIKDHFKAVKNLARTNSLDMRLSDLTFCLIYGEPHEKNSFIKEVEEEYPVHMGKDFWHRLTGDENFYRELVKAMIEVAKEVNMKKEVDSVIEKLTTQIEAKYDDIFG